MSGIIGTAKNDATLTPLQDLEFRISLRIIGTGVRGQGASGLRASVAKAP